MVFTQKYTDYDIIHNLISVSPLDVLFAEELGLIMEVEPSNEKTVLKQYEAKGVTCHVIGSSNQVVDGDAMVCRMVFYCFIYEYFNDTL